MQISVTVKDITVWSYDPDATERAAKAIAETFVEYWLKGTAENERLCIEVEDVNYYVAKIPTQ